MTRQREWESSSTHLLELPPLSDDCSTSPSSRVHPAPLSPDLVLSCTYIPRQAALVNGGVTPGFGWHYEYGSATAFFVLPRESRSLLLAAADGNTQLDAAIGSAAAAPDGGQLNTQEVTTATGGPCVEDVQADENGIRDLRQVHYPSRLVLFSRKCFSGSRGIDSKRYRKVDEYLIAL